MRYILLFFYFLINWGLSSQNYSFENLNVSDGLPDNSIIDIIQDKRGYLWFGTMDGLSRYGGNNFKNYYYMPQDSTSLRNNRMNKIKEDENGFIWGWSEDSNLQRINPFTDQVIDVRKKLLNESMSITDFKILANDNIWVWGNNGFSKIEYLENYKDLKVTISSGRLKGFKNNPINFLSEDAVGNIWIGTNNGLFKINKSDNDGSSMASYYHDLKFTSIYCYKDQNWFGTKSGKIINYQIKNEEFSQSLELNKSLKNNPIWGINQLNSNILLIASNKYFFEYDIKNDKTTTFFNDTFDSFDRFFTDSFNNVWLIFKNTKGIFRYSITEKKIHYYSLSISNGVFIGDPDKQQILEDSNKNLWVGIHGRGLFHFYREQNRFINYRYEESKNESISSDIILSLFEDNSKNLWVGTMYGGVTKINLNKEAFYWYYPSKNISNYYENEIRAAIEDKNGNIWLGSKGGKIFHYRDNQLVYTFPDDLSNENKQKTRNINVYSLFLDNENNLWVGTKFQGIFILKNVVNTPPKALEIVHLDISPLHSVYSIQQDKYNNFWIGSHDGGLGLIMNPFKNLKHIVFDKEITSNFIRFLFFDKDDNLWIGTSDGISLLPESELNKQKKSFITIKNIRKNKFSLSYNSVDHIFQASDYSIYASTMGGGINILSYDNLKNRIFNWKHIDMSHGLSSNKILAVQEDIENNIWISTDHGINKYYPKQGKIEHFFIEKDQGLNYFTEGCVLKKKNGDLLFGNYKGFITFNPKQIEKDTTDYPLVLSKLFVNGTLILPRKSNLISQNIENETGIKLSHKQNTIRLDFSVLDFKNPKRVLYSYKLENFEDNWSTPLASSTVTYQNLPHGNYTFLLKATNSDGVELKKMLKFNINITPPFFSSPLGYFLEILFLGTLFFVFLYMYKKQISAKQEVFFTEKLNEKKLIYYTNISHEFKTPLTLISCYVQDILNDKNSSIAKAKSQVLEIKKSTSYLLNLVEQILDVRKIREEKMKLFLISTNIVVLLNNIQKEFSPLALKKNIKLTFSSKEKNIYGFIDLKIIRKIMYNLISNALKFTPENKKIDISLELEPSNNFIKIKVKDEGKGISIEDLEHLFERFGKSENSSGLGLSYVKELVNLNKGVISVESELMEGTCFTVKLPISEDYFSKEELGKAEILDSENSLVFPNINNLVPKDSLNVNESNETKGKTKSLLIIEDNNELRNYLCQMFDSTFNVLSAKNGREGVDLCLTQIPNLIICDLMMPVMDGVETIRIIKDNFNTSHIPIILLTANISEDKKMEALSLGADDYINKPFNIAYLRFKIDVLISNRNKIINNLSKTPELSSSILTNSEEDKIFIENVKKMVEDSMGESNFSLEFIASKMGLSRSKFYKRIKEILGETPHEFISVIQMKKAELLIRETNYTIPEIALICGYSDYRYFAKIFKKHFGKSPKEYQISQKN